MMSSPPWPPKQGLCTPTTPASHAVLTIPAHIVIAAPASVVFSILRDTEKYPEWNTFCPRITILSQPDDVSPDSKILVRGTSYILHAVMDLNKPASESPTQLRITDLSTPEEPYEEYLGKLLQDPSFTSDSLKVYRIAWKGEGSFLARGLQTERFHEVIILGEKECAVRTWEIMSGPLAYTVKWMFKKNLEGKFKLWCEDLKKRSENLATETSS